MFDIEGTDLELHISKSFSDPRLFVSDYTYTFNNPSFAELSPQAFFDIRRDLGALPLIFTALIEKTFIIYETKISDEDTASVICFGGMGHLVNT
jgi:hypothetical protein